MKPFPMSRPVSWIAASCLLIPLLAGANPDRDTRPEPLLDGRKMFDQAMEIYRLQISVRDHIADGRLAEALEELATSEALARRIMGPSNPLSLANATSASHLSVLLGDYSRAVEHARRRLDLVERADLDAETLTTALLDLGKVQRLAGHDAEAEATLERALELRRTAFGNDDVRTAEALQARAMLHWRRQERALARELLDEATSIFLSRLRSDDPRLASLNMNLAEIDLAAGRFETALDRLERARSIEARQPQGALGLADITCRIGRVRHQLGDLEAASRSFDDCIARREAILGSEHPELIADLVHSAQVLVDRSQLDRADAVLTRAFTLAERRLGSDHPSTLEALHHRAVLATVSGQGSVGRTLADRAVIARERVLGPTHPDTALSRAALGQALDALGDSPAAITMMDRAITDLVSAGWTEYPITGRLLIVFVDTLARHHQTRGERLDEPTWNDLLELLPHLEAAFERTYGATSPRLADLYQAYAVAALARGDTRRAIELQANVRAVHDALDLGDHPDRIVYFGNEASVRRAAGDLAGSGDAMARALDIAMAVYGPQHPWTLQPRVDLAGFLQAAGRLDEARRLLDEARHLEEARSSVVLATGSEADQRHFLETLEDSRLLALTLHQQSAPNDERAARVALETVLRHKGRALDAAVQRARLVREIENPELAELRGVLERRRARWARDLAGGAIPGTPKRDEIERLERRLADALEPAMLPRVDVEGVRRALPPGSALIEWVAFEPPDIVTYTNAERRYSAYLLTADGPVRWVDLGPSAPIDRAVEAFLAATTSRDPDVHTAARQLDALTFARLRPALGAARHWIVSPEGSLHRIPVAALVDEDGAYLVHHTTIDYVTSGRDLVTLATRRDAPREPPWLVGQPDFEWPAPPEQNPVGREIALPPLPGSLDEATAIGELLQLPPERLLVGSRASERALRAVRGPSILHIATHGLDLDLPDITSGDSTWRGLAGSGLALAGFATGRDRAPENDGFLSAVELAQLDLAGTEIAVLSACHSGRGETLDGHGLFGLRRALVLAGARTQLASLWAVDDRSAVELMRSWYGQIARGVPRNTALRRAQLAMLAGSPLPGRHERGGEWLDADAAPATAHPYHWAVFTLSGDPGAWTHLGPETSISDSTPPNDRPTGGL